MALVDSSRPHLRFSYFHMYELFAVRVKCVPYTYEGSKLLCWRGTLAVGIVSFNASDKSSLQVFQLSYSMLCLCSRLYEWRKVSWITPYFFFTVGWRLGVLKHLLLVSWIICICTKSRGGIGVRDGELCSIWWQVVQDDLLKNLGLHRLLHCSSPLY